MNLPNKLTMLRIILIPVFMGVLYWGFPGADYIALAIFIIASLTDLLDGKIARKQGLITDFGKFMDPLADKILVTSALICFVDLWDLPAAILIVIIAREFIVTSLRLIAAPKGIVIAADKYGKAKTVFQMIWVIATLVQMWVETQFAELLGVLILPLSVLNAILMWVTVALTVLSGFNYVWKNRSVLSDM